MRTLSEKRLTPLLRELAQRERDLRRLIAQEHDRIESEGFAELHERTYDEADHAFARDCLAQESRLIIQHLSEVYEVAGARDRARQGTFGICLDCHDEISYEQLKVNPAAQRCAACQERRERMYGLRPQESHVTIP